MKKQIESRRNRGRLSVVFVTLCCSALWLCSSAEGQVIAISGTGPIAGNQSGLNFGTDFDVNLPVTLTSLGVFDDNSNGITLGTTLTVEIWSRNNNGSSNAPGDDTAGTLLASLAFDNSAPGTLNSGGAYRFLPLASDLVLPIGSYTVSAVGFNTSDPAMNRNFDFDNLPAPIIDDSFNTIQFVGLSRYDGANATGVWPTTVAGVSSQQFFGGSFIYDEPTIEPFMRLTVDRDTGAMSIVNGTGAAVQLLGYSITSPDENLDSDTWKSIADNYDADAPAPDGGTVDPTNNWTRLTKSGAISDLSEYEFGDVNGAMLAAAQTIDLGTDVWGQSPNEDLQFTYTVAGGEEFSGAVEFVGNSDSPFEFGDLNYDGTAFGLDDFTDQMLPSLISDLSSLTITEMYNAGDLDGDMDVDTDDFRIFKNGYLAAGGSAAALSTASIPEPSSGILLLMIGIMMFTLRNKFSSKFFVQSAALLVAMVVIGQGRVEAETVIAFGDTEHSSTGPWGNSGTNINEKLSAPNAGATSTWDFTGLTNGTYYVSVDWTSFSNRTPSAKYSISDGFGDIVIDQQDSTRDFYEFVGGVPVGWLNLGQVTVADNTLNVMLSDDGNGYLFADAIRISTTPGVNTVPGIAQGIVVDNGDAGHAYLGESGSDPVWAKPGPGFDDDHAYDLEAGGAQHTGVLQSQWTITGLTPGKLTDISTTWLEFSNRGSNVPYTISGIDGGDQTIEVNQQLAPTADTYSPDLTARAFPFQSLGTFTPTGTSITVTMSNDANGFAVADAVRVQQFEPLAIEVNTATGNISILNNGSDSYDIDVYEIKSVDGSLDLSNWTGLGAEWQTGGASDEFALSEFNLTGMSTFGPSANQTLGIGYDTAKNSQDIMFSYTTSFGVEYEGLVSYVTSAGVIGDYNNDGTVDAADYTVWRDNLGSDASALANRDPANVDANVTAADYASWKSNFGASAGSASASGSAVPEPSSVVMLLLVVTMTAASARNCYRS